MKTIQLPPIPEAAGAEPAARPGARGMRRLARLVEGTQPELAARRAERSVQAPSPRAEFNRD